MSLSVPSTVLRYSRPCSEDVPQRKHIKDVLDRFQMANTRPVSTPLSKSSPLTKEDCPQSNEDLEYMQMLQWQARLSPDTAHNHTGVEWLKSCARVKPDPTPCKQI